MDAGHEAEAPDTSMATSAGKVTVDADGEGDGGSARMITVVPMSAVPMSPWSTRTSEKVRPPSR